MKHMMKLLVASLALLLQGAALACDKYVNYPMEEIKEYRDMLLKPDADPLDKLHAFELLACSDRPNIRHYALKNGFDNIDEPLVRNEIMLKAMLQKTRIDVELGDNGELTEADKNFIAQHGGVFSNIVSYRSEKDGCISLYDKRSCDVDSSYFIRGNKVELIYSGAWGKFELSASGELVGTLRPQNTAYHTHIPAVIKLF